MMMRRAYTIGLGLAVLGAGVLWSGAAQAHFVLQSPAAMTEQDNLGNPQKTPKCGGGDGAAMTGEVTTFQAGDTITITIDETIYHPGHYRVALALADESELPDAPPVTPAGGDDCAMTEIQDPPVFPVLADGELLHDSAFDGPQSFEVTIPEDVECDNCILQVIEFMSSHGAPCYYYHCANITVEAAGGGTSGTTSDGSTGDVDPSTSGDSDPSTSGGGSTTDDSSNPTSDSNSDTAASDTAPETTGGATATDSGTDGATDSAGEDTDDEGGCACSTSAPGGSHLAALVGLVGLLGLRRRRHR